MAKNADNLPATVQEAVRLLQGLVPEDEKSRIAVMKHEDLTSLHFGLGQWIRNSLGLWQEDSALLAATGEADADDASAAIIQAFWLALREDRPRLH
jgi:hypothetical protein